MLIAPEGLICTSVTKLIGIKNKIFLIKKYKKKENIIRTGSYGWLINGKLLFVNDRWGK